jgi:hypothetical protein
MKKKLIVLLAGLGLSLMAVGCSEGFKGQKSNPAVQGNLADVANEAGADTESVEVGTTPRNIDLEIFNSYENEFRNISQSLIDQLGTSVRAFEVRVQEFTSSPDRVNMTATLKTACDTQMTFSQSAIRKADLQAGQRIRLGSAADFSVRIQCTTSDCQEYVAAIMRSNHHHDVTVLIGLNVKSVVEDGITESNLSTISRLGSRFVDIEGFTTASSIEIYDNLCALAAEQGNVGNDAFGGF